MPETLYVRRVKVRRWDTPIEGLLTGVLGEFLYLLLSTVTIVSSIDYTDSRRLGDRRPENYECRSNTSPYNRKEDPFLLLLVKFGGIRISLK